jgi:hypothetical protein
MTLCVAWKDGDKSYLASDSRISRADMHSDYGIKVCPISIRIYEPASEGKKASLVFDKVYGFAFSGSFLGAYVIKEYLVITLQKLQYISGRMDLSFSNICETVHILYNEIASKISKELDQDGTIDFFFSGYCPKEKKILTAKFFIELDDNLESFNTKLELFGEKDFISAIGSGEDKYKNSLLKNTKKAKKYIPLFALKSLILSEEVASVGGNLQFGQFDDDNNFSIYGIIDIEEKDTERVRVKYCYAGVDFHGAERVFDAYGTDYCIMGEYINPFHEFTNKFL